MIQKKNLTFGMMLLGLLMTAACSDENGSAVQKIDTDSGTNSHDTDTADTHSSGDTGSTLDTTDTSESDSDSATDATGDSDSDSTSESERDSSSGTDCPEPPAEESGFLWFSGYEQSPWDAEWGIAWSALENHEVTSDSVLFGGYAARVTYPEGIVSSEGGAQYRMAFDQLETPVATGEEMYVRYYIRFDDDIDFVLGGKLPGLIGGEANTGGDAPDGFDGWSARIMWRANGRIVQYVYHPDQEGEYGEDMDWNVGGGSRYFIPGQWHCVETYIKMNTVNGEGESAAVHDGIVRSWLDGELALDRTDVRFRYTNDFAIDGFYFSTFFGGSTEEWAPVKDEHAMFDNFVIHNERIGCLDACMIPRVDAPGPDPIQVAGSTLVFNGDDAAWKTGNWGNSGTYDYENDENHTVGGRLGAFIVFDPAAWDATVFTALSPYNPGEYTHLRMWIRPAGPNVRFRVQMRGSNTDNSADVVVDGSPTYHIGTWQPDTWQEVIIPIADFASVDNQTQLLIRSDTNTATDGFGLDDIDLVVEAM